MKFVVTMIARLDRDKARRLVLYDEEIMTLADLKSWLRTDVYYRERPKRYWSTATEYGADGTAISFELHIHRNGATDVI